MVRVGFSAQKIPETIKCCGNEPFILGRASDKALYDIPPRAAKLTEKTHLFMVRTFSEPTQCAICCSYMLGLWRQGVICQECELPCHIHCAKSADQTCPLPLEYKNKKTEGLDTVNFANEMVKWRHHYVILLRNTLGIGNARSYIPTQTKRSQKGLD